MANIENVDGILRINEMTYVYSERMERQYLNKQIVEDWEFEITVTKVNYPCRMGFETGDSFKCKYECPTGFCPKTMPVLHTLCEVIRCGGDYRFRGSKYQNEIDFICADSCIEFHMIATHLDV